MDRTRTPAGYGEAVRSFDHAHLAALPAYTALRQALSDLANEAPVMELADFLDAVRDMAATAPFGDTCDRCDMGCTGTHHHDDPVTFPLSCGAYRIWWPHAAEREGGGITGSYRCGRGQRWTCLYAIAITGMSSA